MCSKGICVLCGDAVCAQYGCDCENQNGNSTREYRDALLTEMEFDFSFREGRKIPVFSRGRSVGYDRETDRMVPMALHPQDVYSAVVMQEFYSEE